MLAKIIEWSGRNRFLVLLMTAVIVGYGAYVLLNIPVDAIPDLSDTQVIIYSRWDRSPVPAYGTGPRYRDRDRDGIPDRYDRRPGRHDGRGDRDRDGVPNRYDERPNDPYRR